MRDGYYLSTYIHIDEFASIARLKIRHDQSISLWHKSADKVSLIHYWEFERLTGMKQFELSFYSVDNVKEIINFLLKQYNLSLDNIVEVWGTPRLQTCEDYHSLKEFKELSYHSISHLFSGLMCDTEIFYNNDIIGLAVDGAPDSVILENGQYFFSGCFSQKGKVQAFSIYSPAPLWTAACRHTGMREGTLMALGSASTSEAYIEPDYVPLLRNSDDIYDLKPYMDKLINSVYSITEKDKGKLFNGFDSRFSIEENQISMLMKIIHKISIKIMEVNIDNIVEKFGVDTSSTYLAMAGGYSLNCPNNSYLMNKYKFKGFIAPPCVNDSGLSLGMALYSFYKQMDKVDFKLGNAYYGDSDYSFNNIINSGVYNQYIESVTEFQPDKAVEDVKSNVIVWFNGASELGPRALGNRSLLADPRTEASKDQLNIIKCRQMWRPVAPVILEEDVYEWFDDAYPTPFMLHTFNINKDKKSIIPAVAHLDGSARVQTLKRDENNLLYDFLQAFKENTGVPILCNTSLNDKGEPIINRIEEALNFALRKKIKVVYINGKRVELKNHENYLIKSPLPRLLRIQTPDNDGDESQSLLHKLNPYGLPKSILTIYYHTPRLREKFDITKARDVQVLVKIIKKMYSDYLE